MCFETSESKGLREVMTDTAVIRGSDQDALNKLSFLKSRFSDGFVLIREHLLMLGWLHFLESGREGDSLAEHEVKHAIMDASRHLHLDVEPQQLNQIIQKLLQMGVLKAAVVGRRQGYRLARLGRKISEILLDEVDYGSEQLNSLLGSALSIIKAARLDGENELRSKLQHVFFDTIRERIENKVAAIEEDLERRKQRVRETYSGQNEADRDQAQRDLEYSREALIELVDAVKGSSACEALEVELIECTRKSEDKQLRTLLGRAHDFLFSFRERIDLMLADLVDFITDCAAIRSLAFSLTARDRLCRSQDKILAYALDHTVCMPVLSTPGLPTWGLPTRRKKRKGPVIIDIEKLETLCGASSTDSFSIEHQWKKDLLEVACQSWKTQALSGEVDLSSWLRDLAASVPEIIENPQLALLFLTEDWSSWTPPVLVRFRDDAWSLFAEGWMMRGSPVLVPGRDLTEV